MRKQENSFILKQMEEAPGKPLTPAEEEEGDVDGGMDGWMGCRWIDEGRDG